MSKLLLILLGSIYVLIGLVIQSYAIAKTQKTQPLGGMQLAVSWIIVALILIPFWPIILAVGVGQEMAEISETPKVDPEQERILALLKKVRENLRNMR